MRYNTEAPSKSLNIKLVPLSKKELPLYFDPKLTSIIVDIELINEAMKEFEEMRMKMWRNRNLDYSSSE